MRDTTCTPPPTATATATATAAADHRPPFTRDPGRWEAEHARALSTGHVRDHTCTAECQPVLVYEHTSWGWLAWTVPGDGTRPEIPHQIGVLPPNATRIQRLALRWLTRRPAHRIALAHAVPGSLRLSTAAVALVGLAAGLFAMANSVPVDVALPAMLLAPALAEHLPGRLDARAREHVRIVEGDVLVRYLQRLAALQTSLVQAADGSDRYELRRSAETGQHVLWDAAGLLQTQDTRAASDHLIARERLMLQLADQAAQILQHTADDTTTDADQAHEARRPLGPYPPGFRPTTPPAPRRTPDPEGTAPMPQPAPSPPVRTPDVYLLFAHEPYYPGPATQEINTTVVAAGSLLHPQVLQPDGARIHALLTQGRQPGAIIPLATLTHELNGGADWPTIGDWHSVTTDLVRLVRTGECDALSLGLPDIARALICTGPHGHVRTLGPATGEHIDHGPAQRDAVLAQIGAFLAGLVAEHDLWPGDGLLSPLTRGEAR